MEQEPLGKFARLGMALADWSQKWFPDAFVFALVAILVVFVAGLFVGTATRDLVRYFGDGFWSLIPFTMQMAMIIIGSYVVSASPPVHRLIRRLACIPHTPRGEVALVAFFSMATSLISWAFGPIFAGFLARGVVRRVRDRLPRDRRCGVSRYGERVGAGAFIVRCAADGDSFFAARGTAQDQRSDSAEPDDLYLAEHADGRDPDDVVGERGIFDCAVGVRADGGIIWRHGGH